MLIKEQACHDMHRYASSLQAWPPNRLKLYKEKNISSSAQIAKIIELLTYQLINFSSMNYTNDKVLQASKSVYLEGFGMEWVWYN